MHPGAYNTSTYLIQTLQKTLQKYKNTICQLNLEVILNK